MRFLRLFICMSLLVTAAAEARSGPGTGTADKGSGLDKVAARKFIQENLTLIAKRDERIFSAVTDGSRVLTPDFTRRVLGYRAEKDRRNARLWRRLFPGYSRLPKHHIKYIKITERHGPLRAEVRVQTGGTENSLQWKTVKASFVMLKVKLPRRSRALNCKVYKIEGRLYWEPFGW